MLHHLNILSSVVSSTLRGWRGASGSKHIQQPVLTPMLFDAEDDAECRLVREALTELNLDVLIYPCPQGGSRFSAELKAQAGTDVTIPYLVDPNTHVKLAGAQAINAYLFQQYKVSTTPKALQASTLNLLSSRLASTARFKLTALQAQASKPAPQPLVLYSFEASPYSRPVREKLCQLELAYKLINLGKQQLADVGPATFRLHTGEYHPLPNSKRAKLLAEKGRVQVPFLIDVNQNIELFESKDILRYLEETYALR
ncbi:glutathione S-transferase N-terminal domain-containing protein [Agitococcus lubricus]|uniref:Glutathione S-transferase-like protein n=1 Tax=Agitococcus lubricus TaxID=1077255 RepID=A0A2T5IZM9_9GAMM|nr:glutathione S-transferase N-terminal domain-containing protein [Agitococcus lubricus]PTQ89416.1 glutathione S-transferase-like protein [Agitococcus lubricus]